MPRLDSFDASMQIRVFQRGIYGHSVSDISPGWGVSDGIIWEREHSLLGFKQRRRYSIRYNKRWVYACKWATDCLERVTN